MIKSISLAYPTFWEWLDIKLDFKPWINLIEQNNWWWKTTVLNTIHSFFTGKFSGLTTLPDWNAILEFSNWDKWMLAKNKWIWAKQPNELFKYITPWKFFELNSVEQREVFTKLFNIDYNIFMAGKIPWWHPDYESDLKKKEKDYLSKEEILLKDIQELKSVFINLWEYNFSDVEEYLSKVKLLEDKVKEYNLSIQSDIINYEDINFEIKSRISELNNLKEELKNINNTCSHCWWKISEDKLKLLTKELQWMIEIKSQMIQVLQNKLSTLIQPEIIVLNQDNINEIASKFLIEINNINPERFKLYEEYKINKSKLDYQASELKKKEELLKTFNTMWIQAEFELIKQAKKEFTEYLQKIVSALPIKIELFEVLKNWNERQTFKIFKDWVEYNNLSTGNKNLIQILISKMFIDNLWLDFILFDEASHISKENLSLLKELAKDYQVILFKPTWWTITDL